MRAVSAVYWGTPLNEGNLGLGRRYRAPVDSFLPRLFPVSYYNQFAT